MNNLSENQTLVKSRCELYRELQKRFSNLQKFVLSSPNSTLVTTAFTTLSFICNQTNSGREVWLSSVQVQRQATLFSTTKPNKLDSTLLVLAPTTHRLGARRLCSGTTDAQHTRCLLACWPADVGPDPCCLRRDSLLLLLLLQPSYTLLVPVGVS